MHSWHPARPSVDQFTKKQLFTGPAPPRAHPPGPKFQVAARGAARDSGPLLPGARSPGTSVNVCVCLLLQYLLLELQSCSRGCATRFMYARLVGDEPSQSRQICRHAFFWADFKKDLHCPAQCTGGGTRAAACEVPHWRNGQTTTPLLANRGGALRLVGQRPGGARFGQHVVARSSP